MYQTLGFTRWPHYKLTLFPLSVTPEGCNPESGHSISGSSKMGFTLLELLVVVLIIGILAAVALPQYQVAVAKSRLASYIPLMRSLQQAQEQYYMANGFYATDIRDLDVECSAYGTGAHEGWCYLGNKGVARMHLEGRDSFVLQDDRVDNALLLFFYTRPVAASCYGYNDFGKRVCHSLTGDNNPKDLGLMLN
ncbi:MAG: type IV pilin protein, partial [Candidatus Avelusimicrobium sp.]